MSGSARYLNPREEASHSQLIMDVNTHLCFYQLPPTHLLQGCHFTAGLPSYFLAPLAFIYHLPSSGTLALGAFALLLCYFHALFIFVNIFIGLFTSNFCHSTIHVLLLPSPALLLSFIFSLISFQLTFYSPFQLVTQRRLYLHFLPFNL